MGYLCSPCRWCSSFWTAVPHKEGVAKQPVEWGHYCPSVQYHAVLNSTSWVIVKLSQSSKKPITNCSPPEQGSVTMDTCVCICVCDQNNLPPGTSNRGVTWWVEVFEQEAMRDFCALLTESPSVCLIWLISCCWWENVSFNTLKQL